MCNLGILTWSSKCLCASKILLLTIKQSFKTSFSVSLGKYRSTIIEKVFKHKNNAIIMVKRMCILIVRESDLWLNNDLHRGMAMKRSVREGDSKKVQEDF